MHYLTEPSKLIETIYRRKLAVTLTHKFCSEYNMNKQLQ
jgi:hypothetical protein